MTEVLFLVMVGATTAGILWWYLTRELPPEGAPYWRPRIGAMPRASSGSPAQHVDLPAGTGGGGRGRLDDDDSPTQHVDLPAGTLGWEEGRSRRLGGGHYRIGARQDGWVSVGSDQPGGGERWFWVSEETVFPPR